MSASHMGDPATPDLAIREPVPGEAERVLHLFRPAPLSPDVRLIAAARTRPVERFIAALAWQPVETVGRFQVACQPGVARSMAAGPLLDRLSECARQSGMKTLQCANLLTDDNEWFGILQSHGFSSLHAERSFEVPYAEAWNRVMRLHERHKAQIPAGWRTDPIRAHPAETVLELIAPHRLMPNPEVRDYWRGSSQLGFEPEWSCILFDRQRPFGAFLLRRVGDGVYIDVQVVQEPNPRLRSLGDLFMLYHGTQRVPPDGPLRWLWFRSGAIEHRQTANLALRMGGRELARRHLMSKTL